MPKTATVINSMSKTATRSYTKTATLLYTKTSTFHDENKGQINTTVIFTRSVDVLVCSRFGIIVMRGKSTIDIMVKY